MTLVHSSFLKVQSVTWWRFIFKVTVQTKVWYYGIMSDSNYNVEKYVVSKDVRDVQYALRINGNVDVNANIGNLNLI